MNPADVAITVESVKLLLLGERKCYGRGGGVTGGSYGRRQEASAGPLLSSGGVIGGADRRRDDRCRGRRGKHRSQGRGREQALPEGRAPAIPEEDCRNYFRRRIPVLPEGATVGGAWEQLWERREEEVSEGQEEALPEGSSASITGGGDCRRDRRRRALMPALSPPVTPALSSSGNARSRPFS